MKFYSAVFVFYLNAAAMCGKEHTDWEMDLFFSQFANAGALVQTWLLGVIALTTGQPWVQRASHCREGSCPTRDWCPNR